MQLEAGTEIGFLLPDTQVSLNFSPEIQFPGILNRWALLNSSMNWNEVSIHTRSNSYPDSAMP
jgi:hypothetical protein